MFVRIVRAETHEHPDRSGRGIQDIDPVLVDYLPHPVRMGIQGMSFVHHGSCSGDKGAVYDIGVAGYPAGVSRTPENISFLYVKDPLKGAVDSHLVTPMGMKYPLGLARGSRRVQDKERVFGIQANSLELLALTCDQVFIPDVTTVAHVERYVGPVHHDHGFDCRTIQHRVIYDLFQLDQLSVPVETVCSDDNLCLGIVGPITQGYGAEAGIYHAVHSADLGAGEHGNGDIRKP